MLPLRANLWLQRTEPLLAHLGSANGVWGSEIRIIVAAAAKQTPLRGYKTHPSLVDGYEWSFYVHK